MPTSVAIKPSPREIAYYRTAWPLFGITTPAIVVILLISAAFGSIAMWARLFSIVFDLVAVAIGFINIGWLTYLVFNTLGRGHYIITTWQIADTIFGYLLAQTAVNVFVWKTSVFANVFSNTPATASVFFALYDLFIYTFLLLTSGGVIDNFPVSEATRVLAALQCGLGYAVGIVLLSAAVATLTTHTDEPTAN